MKDAASNRKLTVVSLALISVILVSYVTLVYYPEIVLNSAYARSDEKANSVSPELVSASTKFAFDLFGELVAEEMNRNVFISPLSVSLALAMSYDGAGGLTKDAMAKTLHFGNMSLEEINLAYSNLIGSLENVDRSVKILIANSLWMSEIYEPAVNSSFLETAKVGYGGEVFTRDFWDAQLVSEVNGWVDQRTEGQIKETVQEGTIDPELTVMLLLNAIYFKGEWKIMFDEADTKKQAFFLPEGNTVQVDMMSTKGNFSYYWGENCEVARLPYGRDKLAMYVFLPREDVSLDSFIASLDQTTHDEYISRLRPTDDLKVQMPRFEVEYGVKRLNSVLDRLGMGTAFDRYEADFTNIAYTPEGKVYMSYVDHKAVVTVNEKGTEAAAATVAQFNFSGSSRFVVNRPFYFEIRDDRSGMILFMGKIHNPVGT